MIRRSSSMDSELQRGESAYVIITCSYSHSYNPFGYWYHLHRSSKHSLLLAKVGNLQNRLSEVLSAQHAQESINSIVNALGDTELRLESALREPLL
jgi:hypothetical protein